MENFLNKLLNQQEGNDGQTYLTSEIHINMKQFILYIPNV